MAKFAFLILFFSLFFMECRSVKHARCNTTEPVENLPWLKAMVADMNNNISENKDAQIYMYTYLNRPVFYIQNRCCDIPSELYDCQGNKICEPDGGITGKGDQGCLDFMDKREEPRLIWPIKGMKMSP